MQRTEHHILQNAKIIYDGCVSIVFPIVHVHCRECFPFYTPGMWHILSLEKEIKSKAGKNNRFQLGKLVNVRPPEYEEKKVFFCARAPGKKTFSNLNALNFNKVL